MASRFRRWLESIESLFDSTDNRESNSRPVLSDADFQREYYANTEVTYETCVEVRRTLCRQLRLCNTRPTDNVASLCPDVDIGEICFEIGDELGVSFPNEIVESMAGTVDALLRQTQRLKDERALFPKPDKAKSS